MSNELHPCLTCQNLTEHDQCAICNPEAYIVDGDDTQSSEMNGITRFNFNSIKLGIMHLTGIGVEGNLERLNVCEILLKELSEDAHCYPHLAKMLIHCRKVRDIHIEQNKLEPIKEDKPIVYTTDYSDYANCPNCGIPDGNCNC